MNKLHNKTSNEFGKDLKELDIYNMDGRRTETELASTAKNRIAFDNDFNDDLNESVMPLTVRDGMDYDDNRMNYPKGFSETDDLNGDGIIDPIEASIKIIKRKGEIRGNLEDKVKDAYLQKFRKEVDFHHKVAHKYEKVYRIVKRQPQKQQALNVEIIEIISEHGDYIEQDPLALFYCLYFCIYYNNPDLVEFLRTLIQKMAHRPEKIDQLLEYIDVNGIQRLRTIGEVINTHVYHMVLYQAVDDDLRVVYSQILRQLKMVQLRDKDALQFLKQRDYELIRLTFEKLTTKINLSNFFKKTFIVKSNGYKKYNPAFYEEILIDYSVEQRITQNYRERFLVSKEDIYLVSQMYAQNDYVAHFLKADATDVSHSQFIELFSICMKNDSFKIGLQIYLRFLS